jgi:hypothetical protein
MIDNTSSDGNDERKRWDGRKNNGGDDDEDWNDFE